MRILVCGGRDFDDYDYLVDMLDHYYEEGNVIISGEARGVDTLAKKYAEMCQFEYEGYPADWARHGKKAGPIRNRQMLIEGRPDLVIAFPGGAGTRNMIYQAKKANVDVVIIP